MELSGGIQASLGGRYAFALFELAREAKPAQSDAAGGVDGTIDAVEASLAAVRDALAQSDDFRLLTTSPLVTRDAAVKAIQAVAESIGIDRTTKNFLCVLAENHRLAQLPTIIRSFRALAAQHRGETTAEVSSAHPLSDDQVDQLKQQLRKRIGRDVTVDLTVDPALLGGLVVRIGSQRIDSSIRTRLNALAHVMKVGG